MRRHVTTAQLDDLHARGLPDRQFRRAVYALEHGADALRLLDLRTRRDVTAALYRQALDAALLRLRDGSLLAYQLRTLTQAFANWQAAVSELGSFEIRRRVPAAAE
ncbi:hypothetical protein M5E06_21130 [Azospirillum sp. A1-3]|uniref:hypothetical protein n=1 Tax=Azospirillum sp. A1-3 TaxID=185874 RepID=UPI0020779007|nr:hypothetical protein [Azospirillum sp. A1-3]MCM8736634.1 hypothetical protein [Azospirillum sp. A1-3]